MKWLDERKEDMAGEMPGSSFWTGGYRAYLKALEEEESRRIAAIEREIAAGSNPQVMMQLLEQIQAIRMEYQRKRESARRCDFVQG